MNPLVSIVVPVYNAEKHLKKAIESVLHQTYSEFELLLVNDGSKDNSLEICNKYAIYDNRIKVITQENKGAGAARNTGIKNAKGKYLMFMDSDDFYESEIVEELVAKIEETKKDIAICAYRIVSDKGESITKIGLTESLSGNSMFQQIEYLAKKRLLNLLWNKIFRLDIIRKHSILIDESLIVGEDLRFVLQYFDKCTSIAFVDKPLYNYITLNSYITQKYREKDFECRSKNITYYMDFCQRHNIKLNLYFQYIKLMYSTCMQMEHESCHLTLKEKKEELRKIIIMPEMKVALKKAIVDDLYSTILLFVAKSKNVNLIMAFSRIILLIRNKKIVKWERVSI